MCLQQASRNRETALVLELDPFFSGLTSKKQKHSFESGHVQGLKSLVNCCSKLLFKKNEKVRLLAKYKKMRLVPDFRTVQYCT